MLDWITILKHRSQSWVAALNNTDLAEACVFVYQLTPNGRTWLYEKILFPTNPHWTWLLTDWCSRARAKEAARKKGRREEKQQKQWDQDACRRNTTMMRGRVCWLIDHWTPRKAEERKEVIRWLQKLEVKDTPAATGTLERRQINHKLDTTEYMQA